MSYAFCDGKTRQWPQRRVAELFDRQRPSCLCHCDTRWRQSRALGLRQGAKAAATVAASVVGKAAGGSVATCALQEELARLRAVHCRD